MGGEVLYNYVIAWFPAVFGTNRSSNAVEKGVK